MKKSMREISDKDLHEKYEEAHGVVAATLLVAMEVRALRRLLEKREETAEQVAEANVVGISRSVLGRATAPKSLLKSPFNNPKNYVVKPREYAVEMVLPPKLKKTLTAGANVTLPGSGLKHAPGFEEKVLGVEHPFRLFGIQTTASSLDAFEIVECLGGTRRAWEASTKPIPARVFSQAQPLVPFDKPILVEKTMALMVTVENKTTDPHRIKCVFVGEEAVPKAGK